MIVQYLLMMQLPFMEDVRQFTFGSLPGEQKNATPSGESGGTIYWLVLGRVHTGLGYCFAG